MRLRVRLSRVHELGVTVLVTVANPRHRIRQSIFVAPLWRKVEPVVRSEEHTSELQSHVNLVCRLLLEKKKHCPAPWRSESSGLWSPDRDTPVLGHLSPRSGECAHWGHCLCRFPTGDCRSTVHHAVCRARPDPARACPGNSATRWLQRVCGATWRFCLDAFP